MKVAVLGANGQLAGAVLEECRERFTVVPYDRQMLDVTDGEALRAAMSDLRPDAIINCSGYNAVDAAETHPVDALKLNAFAVRSMARAAGAVDAVLVHYSSDFVFDGTASQPMTEDDPPNPRSTYATSKLLGEWFAMDAAKAYVLRVESLFGAAAGRRTQGSVAGIVNALVEGKTPKVFEDRTVSPTFIDDCAMATRVLLERVAPYGLYHCVNSGHATWLEFALEAARLLDVEPRVERVRVADVTLPAARPKYCALSNAKLLSAGISMPTWQDALKRYVRSQVRVRNVPVE
jgi:dTDP-4-dehydrorhamnose reductase